VAFGFGDGMALRKDIRVLVVDDMAVSRQILVQMLEQLGVNVVRTAQSGAEAVKSLAQFPADMIISDLIMPDMDGLQLLKRLRDDRRSCRIVFILTSADDSNEKITDAWQLGLDRFLPKPFELPRLMTCLEAVAGRI
jgi:two-component system chemotaxis response regulator CheY